MNVELADHIVLVAAPIFAVILAPWVQLGDVSVEKLKELRYHAIQQALALRLDVLDTRS